MLDVKLIHDNAKAKFFSDLLSHKLKRPVDPEAEIAANFINGLIAEGFREIESAAPAAGTTEAASNLGVGPEIKISIEHLDITVKGVFE